MHDEPLKDWAHRRDQRIGRLRAVPVVSATGPRGAHVSPAAPRVIERWNGYTWELHTLAASLTEAQAILYPDADEAQAEADLAAQPLRPGRGKHRKPPAPGPDRD
ncbi:hypothetical protein JJV70_16945 [Streptomyces sp. JJ66]|uniref:DUF6087 family protein n=1 Tax=Streptomyces sp. JJ66 TaxID=2803843 RepID=UPI001C5601BE|nr:DUF6087 family protein [Streptomyces sp. JJ66]MBW1603765.1 hypothetical protein [Streptomyces sp. JJ66]